MSEHWKSTPKYWCKHCTTYVKDTPFERKQHEATGKHQGNLKRFLSGIQKDHAKNEREKEKAKAEIDRLNRITGSGAPSSSIASSLAPSSSGSTKHSSGSSSAADQKRQWAQLAEMGIATPASVSAEMAMAGNWQTISRQVEAEPEELFDDKLNVGVRKRKFEDDEEREEAGETVIRKGWGSTTKQYPDSKSTHQDPDLDALLSGSLTKKDKDMKAFPSGNERSSLVLSAPTLHNLSVKAEQREADLETLLSAQQSGAQDTSTNSRRASQITDETLDADTNPRAQTVSAPIFKKRKAKQTPATKNFPEQACVAADVA